MLRGTDGEETSSEASNAGTLFTRDGIAAFLDAKGHGSVLSAMTAAAVTCGLARIPDELRRALIAATQTVLLTDRIMDEEPGLHDARGIPVVGAGCIALVGAMMESLAGLALPLDRRRLLARIVGEGLWRSLEGQEREVATASIDENEYWRICAAKSEAGIAATVAACAIAAGQPIATLERWSRIGAILGRLIQIRDDLHDALVEPPQADWRRPRRNLLFLYAVLSGGGAALDARIRAAADDVATVRAALRVEIAREGAVAYAHYLAHENIAAARGELRAVASMRPGGLADLLATIEREFRGLERAV